MLSLPPGSFQIDLAYLAWTWSNLEKEHATPQPTLSSLYFLEPQKNSQVRKIKAAATMPKNVSVVMRCFRMASWGAAALRCVR